jgi:hypothetical protein
MAIDDPKPCPCGSGENSYWQLDGNGIPLARVCSVCKQKTLSKFRPEILRPYTQNDVDELIDEDRW